MRLADAIALHSNAAEKSPKCPYCGSTKYSLMPTDFETAKCKNCGRNWHHGIVKGINNPGVKAEEDPTRKNGEQLLEEEDLKDRWKHGDVTGLGDVVKKVTTAVGIKPCNSCEERRRALNNMLNWSKRG